jgi:O-methyltransferase
MLKAIIKNVVSKLGYKISKLPPNSPGHVPMLQLWEDDNLFNSLMEPILSLTLVDKLRCYMIYQYSKHVKELPGEIAEVGVYKGGTARLLAKMFESTSKTVHLFDTFAGMPKSDPGKDFHKEGDFSDTSLEAVQGFLAECPNIKFYKGFFPQTSGPVEGFIFSMVHIDVDIYQSTKACCEFFYPRMQRGGIMV